MPSPLLHIAIIPDGNRRWARKRALQPWKGHEQGAKNFNELIRWCVQDGRIGTLTFWCFSTENWKRDPGEVAELMRLLEQALQQERDGLLEQKIRLVRSGRDDRIAPALLATIEKIGKAGPEHPAMTLHFALDYGGKDEIVRAVRKLASAADATEEDIQKNLDHPELPDIDLVIRTSGEQRTSNFCLWQSTYAEWMFIDTFFPDFSAAHLDAALQDFSSRKRRFGA